MKLQQCHPNLAGSLVTARRTECNPHCFVVVFCVVSYPPNWGKWPRYIDIQFRLQTLTTRASNLEVPEKKIPQTIAVVVGKFLLRRKRNIYQTNFFSFTISQQKT